MSAETDIISALHRLESKIDARIDALDSELTDAISGLRDRHHDGMNILQSEVARISNTVGMLRAQIDSHQKLFDTATAAINATVESQRIALADHKKEEGHPKMLEWRANLTGRMLGFALGISIGGGAMGAGVVAVIQAWLGGP